MAADANRKSMLSFYDAFNRRDFDAMPKVAAPDFIDHEVPEGMPNTLEGSMQYLGMLTEAFPDIKFEVLDVMAEGDHVVARVRTTGTHEGELLGIPATGRKVTMESADWVRFNSDGQALEHWGYLDNLKMMQQLGVIPENPTGA